jgi:hypothetical protein
MLNEEKIKLMTRITIFEKHEESKGLRISKYYKEDYIRYGGLAESLCSKGLESRAKEGTFLLLFIYIDLSHKNNSLLALININDAARCPEIIIIHENDVVKLTKLTISQCLCKPDLCRSTKITLIY